MAEENTQFKLQDSQKVLFIGDSITDCDRRGSESPFGLGYVRFAIDFITAAHPELNIEFINRGISGDVCPGLRNRWKKDVLAHKPDWVSVLIGINDVHRCSWPDKTEHVDPQLYRQAYLECLNQTKDHTDAKLLLMDPFYICRDPQPGSIHQAVLDKLANYIEIATELAHTFNAIHIPLHEIFQHHLKYRDAETFCPEPVHPNHTGHMLIAHAWLKAMGW